MHDLFRFRSFTAHVSEWHARLDQHSAYLASRHESRRRSAGRLPSGGRLPPVRVAASASAARKFGVEVHSYCLMTNHFHLLIHCPRAGLVGGDASHRVSIPRWFNDRYERDGPVFRGRFRSVLVESDEQLVQLSRYIHRNPLALVPRSGLASYQWSSYGSFLARRPEPTWLTRSEVLSYFGGDIAQLRIHVETDQPADRLPPLMFRNRRPTTLDELDAAVAVESVVDQRAEPGASAGLSKDARLLTVTLAIELRIATAAVIAERYALGEPASRP